MLVSKWAQHAVYGFLRRRGEDDGALAACMKEVNETGAMRGPFNKQQVAEQVGSLFVPMPRFCIEQGGKLRAIDHASLYGHNSTVSVPWKLVLRRVDEVAAIAATWIKAVKDDRKIIIQLPGGARLEGTLHEDFSIDDASALMGRLADLECAYKQLASSPAHAFARVVAAYSCGDNALIAFSGR